MLRKNGSRSLADGERRPQRTGKLRGLSVLTALAVITMLGISPTQRATADGREVAGNNNCAELIPGALELRINAPGDGTFSSNGFSVTIDVRQLLLDDPVHAGNQSGSQVFDFDAVGGSVIGVAVKGGSNTNFYDYRPSGVTGGDALHAPVNPQNKKFYGLSHISFCYVETADDVITLKKTDLAGNPLAGAGMELWKETNGTPGLQTTGLTPDTRIGTCTTGADGIGDCTFTITESGKFYGHEASAPPNYRCCAPDQFTEVTRDATRETVTLTFEDAPAAGSVSILKTDDAGNELEGVIFRLTGTSNLGTVYSGTDRQCTTGADGTCTISDVQFGSYSLDETNLAANYAPDPDLPATVVIDEDGEIVSLSFENSRLFTKIVLVCFGDKLYQSTVTENDGDPTTTTDPTYESLSGTGLTDEQQAALCSTGGARFEGNPAGAHQLDVDIE